MISFLKEYVPLHGFVTLKLSQILTADLIVFSVLEVLKSCCLDFFLFQNTNVKYPAVN